MCDVTTAVHGDSESEEYFEFEECFGYFNVQDWFEVENKNDFVQKKGTTGIQAGVRFLLVVGFRT